MSAQRRRTLVALRRRELIALLCLARILSARTHFVAKRATTATDVLASATAAHDVG
jgi:hypothetical protein